MPAWCFPLGEHKLKCLEGKRRANPTTDRVRQRRRIYLPARYKSKDGKAEYLVNSRGEAYQVTVRKEAAEKGRPPRIVQTGLRRVGQARMKERDILTGQYKDAVVDERRAGENQEGEKRQEQAPVDPHRESAEGPGGQ